ARLLVDRFAQSVENASQKLLSDLDGKGMSGGYHLAIHAYMMEIAQRHQHHFVVAEADDFGFDRARAVRRVDEAEFADPDFVPCGFNDQPDQTRDATAHLDGRYGVYIVQISGYVYVGV